MNEIRDHGYRKHPKDMLHVNDWQAGEGMAMDACTRWHPRGSMAVSQHTVGEHTWYVRSGHVLTPLETCVPAWQVTVVDVRGDRYKVRLERNSVVEVRRVSTGRKLPSRCSALFYEIETAAWVRCG